MFSILFPVPQDLILKKVTQSKFSGIDDLLSLSKVWNAYAFENPAVQKLIHSTDLHFDVVINEDFFSDSFLMFGHKFSAPTIAICEFNFRMFFFCCGN